MARHPEKVHRLADYGGEVPVQAGGRFPSQTDTFSLNRECSLQGSTRWQPLMPRPAPPSLPRPRCTHGGGGGGLGEASRRGAAPERGCGLEEEGGASGRPAAGSRASLKGTGPPVGVTAKGFRTRWSLNRRPRPGRASRPGAPGPSEQGTQTLVPVRPLSRRRPLGATEEHAWVGRTTSEPEGRARQTGSFNSPRMAENRGERSRDRRGENARERGEHRPNQSSKRTDGTD